MQGLICFQTPKLNLAVYLLAVGAPMPELREERPGQIIFAFQDPQGDWQKEALRLDLRDTESDDCSVPVARVFAAERILRYTANWTISAGKYVRSRYSATEEWALRMASENSGDRALDWCQHLLWLKLLLILSSSPSKSRNWSLSPFGAKPWPLLRSDRARLRHCGEHCVSPRDLLVKNRLTNNPAITSV